MFLWVVSAFQSCWPDPSISLWTTWCLVCGGDLWPPLWQWSWHLHLSMPKTAKQVAFSCLHCTEMRALCEMLYNQFYTKLIFVCQTRMNVDIMAGTFSSCFSCQSLRQLLYVFRRGPLQGLPISCLQPWRLVILGCWIVSSPTETAALWGFSMSRVDSGGVSIGLSSSSGGWPSPRDQTNDSTERDSMTQSSRRSLFKERWSDTVEELLFPPESHTDRQTDTDTFSLSHTKSFSSRIEALRHMESMKGPVGKHRLFPKALWGPPLVGPKMLQSSLCLCLLEIDDRQNCLPSTPRR